MSALHEWARAQGYVTALPRPGGGLVALLDTNLFNAQIIVGDETWVEERYTYARPVEALLAFFAWAAVDFAGEPEGWVRHQPSNRRRVDGDPDRETVRP